MRGRPKLWKLGHELLKDHCSHRPKFCFNEIWANYWICQNIEHIIHSTLSFWFFFFGSIMWFIFQETNLMMAQFFIFFYWSEIQSKVKQLKVYNNLLSANPLKTLLWGKSISTLIMGLISKRKVKKKKVLSRLDFKSGDNYESQWVHNCTKTCFK